MRALMFRRLGIALAACILAHPVLGLLGRAQSAAPPNTAVPPSTAPIVELFETAGDFHLSDEDRQALEETSKDPKGVRHEARRLRTQLDRYWQIEPVRQAEMHHRIRAALHFNRQKMGDPLLWDILSRGDPVMVEDPGRKDVVTMADLRAFDRSNHFVADLAGVAPPDLTEQPDDREKLNAAYFGDKAFRTALVQAGVRHAVVETSWTRLPADRQGLITEVVKEQVRSTEAVPDAAREMDNAFLQAERNRLQRQRNTAALADLRRFFAGMNSVTIAQRRLDGLNSVLSTENIYAPR